MSMNDSVCFLNGRYLAAAEAKVSAFDRGFLLGEGLFETWRSYRGRPFAVREHMERMAKSARSLGIAFDPNEAWEPRSRSLLKRNRACGEGAAIRLTITRGAGPPALLPSAVPASSWVAGSEVLQRHMKRDGSPSVAGSGATVQPPRLMILRSLDPDLPRLRKEGVSVCLIAAGSGVQRDLKAMKSLNYLAAVIGKTQARAAGAFEGIYCLDDGTILEGTTSNLFAIKKGKLLTPPLAAGILPGVTRAKVLALASKLLPVVQRRLRSRDLFEADEIFLTSSTIEVLPVLRVNRRKVGKGLPGEITRDLQLRYRKHVARSLRVAVAALGD